MGFYYFMLGISAFIPILMHIISALLIKYPPRDINNFYGYRTRRSKLNQDTWNFAHQFVGHLWSKLSLILLAISIFPFIFLTDKSIDVIGFSALCIIIFQVLVLILSIIPVERALKRHFDDNGNPK